MLTLTGEASMIYKNACLEVHVILTTFHFRYSHFILQFCQTHQNQILDPAIFKTPILLHFYYTFHIVFLIGLCNNRFNVDPGGPVVILLATESEVRGFKPGRGRWIFSERKNPDHDFLRKGSKAVGPLS